MSHQHINTGCPFCALSAGAKSLLGLVLEYVAADQQVPSQARLAELMGVQRRTIERWVRQLRESGLVETLPRHVGIDLPIGFDREGADLPTQSDREIGRLPIGMSREIDLPTQNDREQHGALSGQTRLPIGFDREIAHGGGDHVSRIDSTPKHPTRSPRTAVLVSTDTGRYLVTEGFSVTKAVQFEKLPLDQVRADYQRRREMGQKHGAIVRAWENVPPAASIVAATHNGPFTSATVAAFRAEMGYTDGD
jgi:hypothetical protein